RRTARGRPRPPGRRQEHGTSGAGDESRGKGLPRKLAGGSRRQSGRENPKTHCVMGFLKRFFRGRATVQQLPTGTVTVDRHGEILTTTVSSAYSRNLLRDIGRD